MNSFHPHCNVPMTLQWRHNGRDGVSNHLPNLFTQSFIQTQIKENIKAPRHWPMCGDFTGDRWSPRTNGQLRRKCSHLMTSSCSENGCVTSNSARSYLIQLPNDIISNIYGNLPSTVPAGELTNACQIFQRTVISSKWVINSLGVTRVTSWDIDGHFKQGFYHYFILHANWLTVCVCTVFAIKYVLSPMTYYLPSKLQMIKYNLVITQ